MNIGELAKKTGLTASKIRFYESIDLLKLVDRRPNGYRTYPAEAETVLNLITVAQGAGFSLDEIRALLPEDLECWDHDTLINALTRKVADIEALERRLAKNKAQLLHLLDEIQARPNDMDCVANAQRILAQIQVPDEARAGGKADKNLLIKQRQQRRTPR